MSLLTRAKQDRESVLHGEKPSGGRRFGRIRGFFRRLVGSNRVVSLTQKPQEDEDDDYSTRRGEDFATWLKRLFRCNKVAPLSVEDSSPDTSICNVRRPVSNNPTAGAGKDGKGPTAEQGDTTRDRPVSKDGTVNAKVYVKDKQVRRSSGYQSGMEMDDLPGVLPERRDDSVEEQVDSEETTDGEAEEDGTHADIGSAGEVHKENELLVEDKERTTEKGDENDKDCGSVKSYQVGKDQKGDDEGDLGEKRNEYDVNGTYMKPVFIGPEDKDEKDGVTMASAEGQGQNKGDNEAQDEKNLNGELMMTGQGDKKEEASSSAEDHKDQKDLKPEDEEEQRQEQFESHMLEVNDLLQEVAALVNSLPDPNAHQKLDDLDFELDYDIETYLDSDNDAAENSETPKPLITYQGDESEEEESEEDEETLAAAKERKEQVNRNDEKRRKSQFDEFMAEIDELLERQEAMEKDEEQKKGEVDCNKEQVDAELEDGEVSVISEQQAETYESDFEDDVEEMKECVITNQQQQKENGKISVGYMETYVSDNYVEDTAGQNREIIEEEVESYYKSDFEEDETSLDERARDGNGSVIKEDQQGEELYESDFEEEDIEEQIEDAIQGFVNVAPKKGILKKDPTEDYESDFEEEEIEEHIEACSEVHTPTVDENKKVHFAVEDTKTEESQELDRPDVSFEFYC